MSVPSLFEPAIDESRLDDLRHRLNRACNEVKRRPEPVAPFEADKERFGLTHQRYQQLLLAWYDFLQQDRKSDNNRRIGPDHDSWPAFYKKLLSFSHFQIEIEDIKLHYIHEKASPDAENPAIPLLLLHGWPSSVVDFFEVIKPLAHPGSKSLPAFDVVAPSQTGYLWTSSQTVDGFGRGRHSGPQGDLLVRDEARIVHKLMLSLGYDRYAIQAGDWGAAVARHLAAMYPGNVAAVHLNFSPAAPPLLNPPLLALIGRLIPSHIYAIASALTPSFISRTVQIIREYPRWIDRSRYLEEPTVMSRLGHILLGLPAPLNKRDISRVRRAIDFMATGSAYAAMQGSRPSTLGLTMQSDPGAQLAWIGEKLLQWTDEDPPDSAICAILTLYWVTDTMPRSIWQYRNRPPLGPEYLSRDKAFFIRQPTGFSDFPKEIVPAPLSWIKKTANVKWVREHSSGGHFVSLEKPVEYIDDVRDCFAKIWPD